MTILPEMRDLVELERFVEGDVPVFDFLFGMSVGCGGELEIWGVAWRLDGL